ncbi:hypothetical protein A2U01_0058037, partial [Trifolium medium]|nr:hypothetical protein [Trifolium medium]
MPKESVHALVMSVTELNELKGQLEDLSKKNFVGSVISPWRTPLLLSKKKDD